MTNTDGPDSGEWDIDRWGRGPGLPDEAYAHDGLLTKRHARACAFAHLRPRPGELLWDIGAGSGAMGIEWARSAPGARAIGVERNRERLERARGNVARLAPGAVELIAGDAAHVVAGLPAPDAVFVGGGVTSGVLAACVDALRRGGRIVAHGVTLETEEVLVAAYRAHGGALARFAVEHAEPIGRFLGWTPLRTVMQWSARKD